MVVVARQKKLHFHPALGRRLERRHHGLRRDQIRISDLQRALRMLGEPYVDQSHAMRTRPVRRHHPAGHGRRRFRNNHGRRHLLPRGPLPHHVESNLHIANQRSPHQQCCIAPIVSALVMPLPIVADTKPTNHRNLAVDHHRLAVVSVTQPRPRPRLQERDRTERPRRHLFRGQSAGDGTALHHHRADRIVKDTHLHPSPHRFP